MGASARMYVVGPPALREALARALPDCQIAGQENPLIGLWESGRGRFDAVIVSLTAGRRSLEVLAHLRRVRPQMPIVITCAAPDEPLARRGLELGASDYLLEPLAPAELADVLQLMAPQLAPQAAPSFLPSPDELCQFADVLRSLSDGVAPTLERLARTLQRAFDARGVLIEIEGQTASVGDTTQVALEQPIVRGEETIGMLRLGASASAAPTEIDLARLAEYARLIEITVAQARDREHWRELAWCDDLSGLRNRRYFEQALDQLIAQCLEGRLRLTVLLFDIDGFKHYNDQYGHEAGDRLIQEVAMLLRRVTRSTDIVARYGGDEFAAVFWDAEAPRVPGSQHPREPIELMERFRRAIAAHDFSRLGRHAPGPVTISGGLACLPWNGTTRDALMHAADQALLIAKREGKNQIRLAEGIPPEAS